MSETFNTKFLASHDKLLKQVILYGTVELTRSGVTAITTLNNVLEYLGFRDCIKNKAATSPEELIGKQSKIVVQQ
jgi:hypothetical protein